VLDETKQMIPDCKKRLEAASQDLRQFLEKHQNLAATEDAVAAEAVLTECSQY
jgi:exonuclease VII small subunit